MLFHWFTKKAQWALFMGIPKCIFFLNAHVTPPLASRSLALRGQSENDRVKTEY